MDDSVLRILGTEETKSTATESFEQFNKAENCISFK